MKIKYSELKQAVDYLGTNCPTNDFVHVKTEPQKLILSSTDQQDNVVEVIVFDSDVRTGPQVKKTERLS